MIVSSDTDKIKELKEVLKKTKFIQHITKSDLGGPKADICTFVSDKYTYVYPDSDEHLNLLHC